MYAQKGPNLQRIPFLNEEQDDDAYPRFSSEDSIACERRGGLIAFLPSKQALFPKCWDDPDAGLRQDCALAGG
jgi:pantothenate synthetase